MNVRWLLAALALALGLASAAVGWVDPFDGLDTAVVPADAMRPTLTKGSELGYRTGVTPARGDVVVFYPRDWTEDVRSTKILRVVGLPGDTVAADTDRVHIKVDGKTIDESYLFHDSTHLNNFSEKVPEGRLFVMGDWRGNSVDSVFEGSVPQEWISGVVVRVDGRPITPVTAFTAAGLPGEPLSDKASVTRLVLFGVGGVLVVIAVVLGVSAIRRSRRPSVD
ncbi:signal peptidase I [Actinokineospora enzanensis]|uniref:signal peptidase I n=1 Tax=Actinokineospora enzanensis TaxID=155975 RepID=UPI0003774838|nr:signal peptidase I [Actinokineospora enzanensis]